MINTPFFRAWSIFLPPDRHFFFQYSRYDTYRFSTFLPVLGGTTPYRFSTFLPVLGGTTSRISYRSVHAKTNEQRWKRSQRVGFPFLTVERGGWLHLYFYSPDTHNFVTRDGRIRPDKSLSSDRWWHHSLLHCTFLEDFELLLVAVHFFFYSIIRRSTLLLWSSY